MQPIVRLLWVATAFPTMVSADIYHASFTWYGAGDERGSPNCQTKTAACGFYTSPGLSAAVSQNLYGVGPGAGKGPYCGKCLRLNVMTDKDGKTLKNVGKDVIVMVSNLCPADGNPLCAQQTLNSTNQVGGVIDVNVCSDSGAQQAVFGSSGVGLAIGTAEEVDCSLWNGTQSTASSPSTGVSVVTGNSGGGPTSGSGGSASGGGSPFSGTPKDSDRGSMIGLLILGLFALVMM